PAKPPRGARSSTTTIFTWEVVREHKDFDSRRCAPTAGRARQTPRLPTAAAGPDGGRHARHAAWLHGHVLRADRAGKSPYRIRAGIRLDGDPHGGRRAYWHASRAPLQGVRRHHRTGTPHHGVGGAGHGHAALV